MARIILGGVVVVLFSLVGSPLVGQSNLNLPNQPDYMPSAIPKLDLPTSGQPFFSLIEDAIVKQPADYSVAIELPVELVIDSDSQVRMCNLNAPCKGSCQTKCNGSCRSSCGVVCSEEECEEACKAVDETVASISSSDQYCEQMAGLLANALGGSEMSPAKIRAIEEAMKMVATKARENAAREMDHVVFNYEETIEQLKSRMNHMSIVSNSGDDFKAWLHPIYTNQTKTFEQLRSLAQSKVMINRRLEQIESRISMALGSTNPQKLIGQYAPRTHDLSSSRPGNEPLAFQKSTIIEGEKLRKELQQLQARLDQLQPQRSTPVRKASYLHPIYSSEQSRQMENESDFRLRSARLRNERLKKERAEKERLENERLKSSRLEPIQDPSQSSFRFVPRLPNQKR